MEDDNSVWREELSLEDWCLVFALPTNRSEFDASPRSDFCAKYLDWKDYDEKLAAHFRGLVDPLQSTGLNVVRNATLRAFAEAVSKHEFVLLYSHCNFGTSIEFCGKMVGGNRIIRQIPRHSKGIIDLSVCAMSKDFVSHLKRRAPNCGIAYYGVSVPAMASLHYIAYFLRLFREPSMTYRRADLLAKRFFSEGSPRIGPNTGPDY